MIKDDIIVVSILVAIVVGLVAFSINLSYNQVSRDLYLPPMYGRNETWIGYYYINFSYGNVEVEIRDFHNIAQLSYPIVSFNAYSGDYLHAIICFDNSTRTVNAAFHLENVTFSDGSYVDYLVYRNSFVLNDMEVDC